eukprot:8859798-Heterocapsa_arctica.AAC.1
MEGNEKPTAMEIGLVDRAPRGQPSVNAFTAQPWTGKVKGKQRGGKGKGKGNFDGQQKTEVKVPEGYMLI